ncbi:MAG: ankyrin repeat domain-containing protein, partial [Bacteroidota bacterium]
ERGADRNAVNVDGNTALHFAAFNSQVKAIKVLMNLQADPSILNQLGETYLQGLNEGYKGEMIRVLE